MSNLDRLIHGTFTASIEAKQNSAQILAESIEIASARLNQALLNGQKILICGNGGSAAHTQYFSSNLLNRYNRDRPGLPAIALSSDTSTLTSIANDYDYQQVFAKQVTAIGQPGDVLIAISPNGQSLNMVEAVQAANENELTVIALTGGDGGTMAQVLNENSIEIRVPSMVAARIQEVHLLVIHILCELLDLQLLGPED